MPVEPGSRIGDYPELTELDGTELLIGRRSTPSAATRHWTAATQRAYVLRGSVKAETGTSYTFVAGDDLLQLVTFSNASPITVTVPPSVFPVGARIRGLAIGDGQVTVAQGSGVTVDPPEGLTLVLFGQFSPFELIQYASNSWAFLSGDLDPA